MDFSRFRSGFLTAAIGICPLLLLNSCGTPFAGGSSGIDYASAQGPGPIRFTDPRLFRREALINERRRERDFLNTLLTETEQPGFRIVPELVRDVEIISSMSASLGLRFDPAAGLNYRRAEATSELQQEFVTLRLQMQLDQLRRDAAILRDNLESQTAVSEGVPGAGPTSVPTLSSGLTEQSTQELITRIDGLRTALAARLDAARTPLTPGGGAASRQDEFNDRAAYRAQLNSALNAASLDELHDREGSALMRLSFTATVLPPPDRYRRALGVLQMRVEPPVWSAEVLQSVYLAWLSHVNRQLNELVPIDTGASGARTFRPNRALQGLLGAEFFEQVDFLYPLSPASASAACRGLELHDSSRVSPPGCGMLVLAVPRPASITPGETSQNMFRDAVRIIFENSAAPVLPANAISAAARLGRASSCADLPSIMAQTVSTEPTIDVRQMILIASGVHFLRRALGEADLQARQLVAASGAPLPPSSLLLGTMDQHPLTPAAIELVRVYELQSQRDRCTGPKPSDARIPPGFEAAVRQDRLIRIYDLGPREQAQRVSTSARAANAISLVASLAAQVPGSGVGANAGLGYSRSALGRVEALERNPLVVSFTDRTNATAAPTFGWLLGPRAVADPRRTSVELQHRLATYELSVDLSVPGWWPYLTLAAETAWAPNWRNAEGTTVSTGTMSRTVRVPLSTNSADLAALTNLLAGTPAVRIASISDMRPRQVSACVTTELQILGDHIWRADAVIIGGRRFGSGQISVLPDMGGITVTVGRGAFPAAETRSEVNNVRTGRAEVAVLTPYGPAYEEIDVTRLKADGGCAEQDAGASTGASVDPNQLSVASVAPLEISLCNNSPRFDVRGKNLSQITAVKFGSEPGTWQVAANGNRATAAFPSLSVRQVFSGFPRGQLVLEKADGTAVSTQVVTIVAAECS